ncbi:hypothetical protein IBTHAUMO2_1080002 [Nitrosopumilaceae archaeon]|nr:hypothetical protein IBTHAUMO2_1080002 [Nitrosopumilaceae archaeon]
MRVPQGAPLRGGVQAGRDDRGAHPQELRLGPRPKAGRQVPKGPGKVVGNEGRGIKKGARRRSEALQSFLADVGLALAVRSAYAVPLHRTVARIIRIAGLGLAATCLICHARCWQKPALKGLEPARA